MEQAERNIEETIIQIAFEIVSGTVAQQVKVINPAFDEDAIIDGLSDGTLITTTWHDQDGSPSTIDITATGEAIAEIISQEINGEYEDFR